MESKMKSIYECNATELKEKDIFRCSKCDRIFFHLDWLRESRGEWFGFPSYEDVPVSPCCEDSFYELDIEEKSELTESELKEAVENEESNAEWREMRAMADYYMH